MKRRELLQALSAAAVMPEHEHAVRESPTGGAPRSFSQSQFALLRTVCQLIIPREGETGGAIEAGVPEFIDLLASENADYARRLAGGLMWLNAACQKLYGAEFATCSAPQQKEMLQAIAYRASALAEPGLQPGVEFFSLLRDLTLDGFFTSRIGITELRFRGNSALRVFSGCTG